MAEGAPLHGRFKVDEEGLVTRSAAVKGFFEVWDQSLYLLLSCFFDFYESRCLKVVCAHNLLLGIFIWALHDLIVEILFIYLVVDFLAKRVII